MTSGQQDRPEDESDDTGQQNEDSQEGNFVPGSAADPTMGQGSPEVGVGAYYGQVSSPEERNWSMLLHLSAFSGLIIPFANLIAPLVVWLMFRARSDMVDFHGKRALNFQISMTIYTLIAVILSFVLIGIPFLIAFGIISIVWTIVAAVRASRGDPPGYILSIRFLR
jgi:uncharacterized Tic20 family protein